MCSEICQNKRILFSFNIRLRRLLHIFTLFEEKKLMKPNNFLTPFINLTISFHVIFTQSQKNVAIFLGANDGFGTFLTVIRGYPLITLAFLTLANGKKNTAK